MIFFRWFCFFFVLSSFDGFFSFVHLRIDVLEMEIFWNTRTTEKGSQAIYLFYYGFYFICFIWGCKMILMREKEQSESEFERRSESGSERGPNFN